MRKGKKQQREVKTGKEEGMIHETRPGAAGEAVGEMLSWEALELSAKKCVSQKVYQGHEPPTTDDVGLNSSPEPRGSSDSQLF